VSSKNEALVEWSATIQNVFIKDPNGLNLELVGTPPGVPPFRSPARSLDAAPAGRSRPSQSDLM
jgi:hypothetical protein